MGDVAEALMRSPVLVTKWFGYELGAQVEYTSKQGKKGDGERCTISGGHTSESLQTCLDRFIEKYVLCQDSECGKPEIDMVLKRGAPLAAKCRACKWRGELDNSHRVADFILKHPALNTTGFGRDSGIEGRATGKHNKDRKDEYEKGKEPSKERQKERRKSRTSSSTSSEDAEQGGAGAQANAEENSQDQGEDASVLAPAPPLYDKEETNAAIADLRVLAATGAGAGVSEALQALPLSGNFE